MTQRPRLSPAEETLKIQPAALLLDLRIREIRATIADAPKAYAAQTAADFEAELAQLEAARQDLQDVLDYLAPAAATVLGRLAWVEEARTRLQGLYALMGIELDLTEIAPADWPEAVEAAQ